MKKILNIFLSLGFINTTVITVVACSPLQDRYLTIKDIEQTLKNFWGFHYVLKTKFEEDFKNLFKSEEYIFFDDSLKPINEYSLLLKDFSYIEIDENQKSRVKDMEFSLNVYSPNDFEWDLTNSIKLKTTILIGETQNLNTLELNLDIGKITSTSYKEVIDKFINKNPIIYKDGIFLEIIKNKEQDDLYIVGDGKYYEGKIKLKYELSI